LGGLSYAISASIPRPEAAPAINLPESTGVDAAAQPMSVHLENAFETEVCDHLGCHGWLYEDKTANHYDRKLALYPPDLIG
jgi:hypothetical protein